MSTVYDIWKLERDVWLSGATGSTATVKPDALVIVPPHFATQRFADYLQAASDARPFTTVDFTNRAYVETGGTLVISYRATATHPAISGPYIASCSTVYACEDGMWKVISHHHVPLRDKSGKTLGASAGHLSALPPMPKAAPALDSATLGSATLVSPTLFAA